MSTGTTLITRALRMLGVVSSGGSATTNQLADGLVALNGLLESWRNDKLLVYSQVDNSLTMVVAQQSYTIGVSGDLNITRPVKFDDAYMTQSGTDSPVRLIGQGEWDDLPSKTVTSPIVTKAFYNPTMTTSQGTLKVWPVPSAANVLHLITWTALASLAAVGDTVTLPPGYDRMIASNMAIELAPEYGASASQEVIKIARDSMAAVKRINIRPILAFNDVPTASRRGTSNILTGP